MAFWCLVFPAYASRISIRHSLVIKVTQGIRRHESSIPVPPLFVEFWTCLFTTSTGQYIAPLLMLGLDRCCTNIFLDDFRLTVIICSGHLVILSLLGGQRSKQPRTPSARRYLFDYNVLFEIHLYAVCSFAWVRRRCCLPTKGLLIKCSAHLQQQSCGPAEMRRRT